MQRSLQQLLQEHEGTHARLDRLLNALAENPDGPAVAEVLQAFRAALPAHIIAEDQGLFPRLAQAFPDRLGLIQQMVGQHREIAAAVEHLAVEAGRRSPGFPERVRAWADLVRDHMRVEDDVLFQGAEGL